MYTTDRRVCAGSLASEFWTRVWTITYKSGHKVHRDFGETFIIFRLRIHHFSWKIRLRCWDFLRKTDFPYRLAVCELQNWSPKVSPQHAPKRSEIEQKPSKKHGKSGRNSRGILPKACEITCVPGVGLCFRAWRFALNSSFFTHNSSLKIQNTNIPRF